MALDQSILEQQKDKQNEIMSLEYYRVFFDARQRRPNWLFRSIKSLILSFFRSADRKRQT